MFGFKETSLGVANAERVDIAAILQNGTLQAGLALVLALEIRGSNGNIYVTYTVI